MSNIARREKKNKNKKRSTHQTWCLSLLVLFLSNVVVGDGQEGWRMLLSTVPLRRISRLGQYWQKTFVDVITTYCNISPITMPFLTVSAITYSWIAWTATQADSWWLWHVEPDDVVIADIAGQALDIFLHGPESAHKNGIGKTFTHTSIPIHPCTLLKKCKNNNSKMLNSPNMMPLFPGPLPVPCAGGRFFRKLGTWSTTDALSARTLLTEKICENVQQILQLSPAEKKNQTIKNQTRCLSLLVLFLSNVVVGDGQEAWRMLLKTVPLRRTSRLGQYWQKTFVDVITTYCNISRQQYPL